MVSETVPHAALDQPAAGLPGVVGTTGTAAFALVTTVASGGTAEVGLVIGADVVALRAAHNAARTIGRPRPAPIDVTGDMVGLLGEWDTAFAYLEELVGLIRALTVEDERLAPQVTPLVDARLLPPLLRPSKMLYSAQNYPDHVEEMRQARDRGFNAAPIDEGKDFRGDKASSRPYLFLKAPSALTGARDPIRLPEGCPSVDWEVELALAIGRRTRHVAAEDAMAHVAGFMTTNDVSCRDLLFRPDRERLRSDWLACKSHDGFAPMGPLFVPRQFVANHLDLRLHLLVNGETRQDGNTGYLIFTPEEQIEYAARMMTLLPGDIISTGTPGGVGQASGAFLSPGDVVEAEVHGLGRMRNTFVE